MSFGTAINCMDGRTQLPVNAYLRRQLVAIVAHYDCAANPVPDEVQKRQLDLSVRFVAAQCPGVGVLGLWVDDTWSVTQICAARD